jgi:hypothetical protein
MKSFKLKPALLAAAVLSISAYTGLASAHCFNGEMISSTTTQHDLFSVHCDVGVGLLARVNNQVGGGTVTLEIAKPGFQPKLTSDAVSGGAINLATCIAPAPSAAVTLRGGSGAINSSKGDYNILVSKTGAVKTYGVIFHCVDNAGVEVAPAAATHEVSVGINLAPFGVVPNVIDPLEIVRNNLYSPDIDLTIDH